MLKIPKKKLRIARFMLHGGLVGFILILLSFYVIGELWLLALLVLAAASCVIGEERIRAMYKCPECGEKLLLRKLYGKVEGDYPGYCSHCGAAITVEIAD